MNSVKWRPDPGFCDASNAIVPERPQSDYILANNNVPTVVTSLFLATPQRRTVVFLHTPSCTFYDRMPGRRIPFHCSTKSRVKVCCARRSQTKFHRRPRPRDFTHIEFRCVLFGLGIEGREAKVVIPSRRITQPLVLNLRYSESRAESGVAKPSLVAKICRILESI